MAKVPKRHESAVPSIPRDDVVWGNIQLDDYEEIALAPPARLRHPVRETNLPVGVVYEEEQEPDEKYQFGIRHLMIVQVCFGVLLAVMRVFAPSFMAGVLGIATCLMAFFLSTNEVEDKRIRMTWWAIFAIYLTACLGAFLSQP